MTRAGLAVVLAIAWGGCGGDDGGEGGGGGPPPVLGEPHEGEYHLGPVAWTGSFWNACAPYPDAIQQVEGELLAGLSNQVAASGDHCDACVEITTATGRTAIARVVTSGVSNAPGDMDVSQPLFDLLSTGEYPRRMTWRLVGCPTTAPLYVQFQTGAHEDWSSLWIRNPRVAVAQVLVKSARHADFAPMRRGADGTFTDDGGFGAGAFTLRVVGIDGSTFEQSFPGFVGGDLLRGSGNL